MVNVLDEEELVLGRRVPRGREKRKMSNGFAASAAVR